MEAVQSVIFLGSKKIGFQTLNFLIEHADELNIKLSAVFDNPSSLFNDHEKSVTTLAKMHNIPVYHTIEELLELDSVDFLISVQYHEILKPEHISKAKKIAVNLHMAPLPEYRGCNQFSFAIIDEVEEFGTSLHRLEAGIDSGDLIAESRFIVPEECFVKELHYLTEQLSFELFEDTIGDVFNGDYTLTPQAQLAETRYSGFHTRKEINGIKVIDSSWPIEKQKRYFRATYFPPFSPPTLKGSNQTLDMKWYNSLA